MRLVRRHHIIIRLVLLQHQPHHLHIFLRIPPVPPRIHVPKEQLLLQPSLDPRRRPRDLPRHKRLTTPRRFMVEQNPVAPVQPVTLTVIHRQPVPVHLRTRIRRPRPERGLLRLRHRLHLPVHLRRRRLIITRLLHQPSMPHRLQQPLHPQPHRITSILRAVKTHPHMALRTQIVNLLRLNVVQQSRQIRPVAQIPVMQMQPPPSLMRISIDMIDPPRVERRPPPDQPVYFIPLLQQKLRKVRSVLPGDASDKCAFHVVG